MPGVRNAGAAKPVRQAGIPPLPTIWTREDGRAALLPQRTHRSQRGQPPPKELNHPDSESGDDTDKEDLSTQSRHGLAGQAATKGLSLN